MGINWSEERRHSGRFAVRLSTPEEHIVRGWIELADAKKVTEFFLSWYYDWLSEHEPKATGSRREIDNILGLLSGDLNEVLKTE